MIMTAYQGCVNIGGSVRPGEEEEQEEGRPVLDADLSYCSCSQEVAACWLEHLRSRRSRADWTCQESLLSGRVAL